MEKQIQDKQIKNPSSTSDVGDKSGVELAKLEEKNDSKGINDFM